MVTVKKCCGCLSLRTGCIIIGVLNILIGIFGFVAPSFLDVPKWATFVYDAVGAVLIITSIIYLWFGVKEHKEWASKMYIVIHVLLIVSHIVFGIAGIIHGHLSMAINSFIDVRLCLLQCHGRKPQLPKDGIFPFIVYFKSRSRGICVGSLVSRLVVLTAAVCVAGLNGELHDTRPITVVTGTRYRHPLRGIRVQVTTILMPKLPDDVNARRYLLQKSVALLVLRSRVPDTLTEQPLRAVDIDYTGEYQLSPQEECVMIGWHFFYAEDKIDPKQWFLLHRHMRFQLLQLVDKKTHCGELVRKYESAADDLRHIGNFSKDDVMCFRDPDNTAQPCHGMYGAPLVCPEGRVAGLLAAPAAQWPRCDRRSVLVHNLTSPHNKKFFHCVQSLFKPEYLVNWELIKKNATEDRTTTSKSNTRI